jgi:flagellar export protein FliJ
MMAPKFSLQTVLDVRHSKVESLEIELGALNQEKHKEEALFESLINAQEMLYSKLNELMHGDVDLFLMNHLHANINDLSHRQDLTRDSIQQLEVMIEQKRLEVVEAKKSEESLNILKNKEIDRFNEEEKDRDRRFQDDIYISQGFRQRHSEVKD